MMRGNAYPNGWPTAFMNRFYSASQIGATLNMIFDNEEAMFLTVLPIQIAPFLMTLEKKGLLSQGGWHIYYTLSLFVNFYWNARCGQVETVYKKMVFWFFVSSIFVGRVHYNINKYVLWAFPAALQIFVKI
jgi:hypothetical protein